MFTVRISLIRSLFCALLALPALASAATAFEQSCSSKLVAMPVATVVQAPVTVQPGVRQVSSAQLTEEARRTTATAAHRHGKVIVGLTSTTWHYDINVNMLGLGDAEEGFCFKPSIRVELSHAPLDVAVGQEFKPNSCAYHFIREHELEHVRMYQEFLPQAARNLEGTLAKMYETIQRAGTQAEVEARRKEVHAAVERQIKALVALSFQRHQRFDEHDHQHLLALSCFQDIQDVVNSTAQKVL